MVEAAIGKDGGVAVERVREAIAFFCALGAADFEDVGKVGFELEAERDLERLQTVIDQADLLVAGGLVEKFRAEKMDCFAWQALVSFEAGGAVGGGVEIGHIHGEESIVVADGGA